MKQRAWYPPPLCLLTRLPAVSQTQTHGPPRCFEGTEKPFYEILSIQLVQTVVIESSNRSVLEWLLDRLNDNTLPPMV